MDEVDKGAVAVYVTLSTSSTLLNENSIKIMEFNSIKKIYFIGIGGIGMSALARYFHLHGAEVYGYDKTATELTRVLEAEGMRVHYNDDVKQIPEGVDLVVFTPAVPKDHAELNWF